jgi:hypothetical protein
MKLTWKFRLTERSRSRLRPQQHKQHLGQKHVSQIAIFQSDKKQANACCMLLSIRDGPPPAMGEMAVTESAKNVSRRLEDRIDYRAAKLSEVTKQVLKEHVIYG